jgi:ADP-ribose pyrophosphatase YjhB (NUDIX family)
MITFDRENNRFNYRVVGAAFAGERVLLHRADIDNFWTLPGGRVELLEPSDFSLKREMLEELGLKVEIERLLWWVENFFDYNGKNYHELALYYLITLPPDSAILQKEVFKGIEAGTDLTFRWFSTDELADLPIYPSFLKTGLKELPDTPRHVIHHDEKKPAEMYLRDISAAMKPKG